MKTADSTKNFPDASTKPTKHKLTNKRPTIQFFPEHFFFKFIHNEKKQGPPGTRISAIEVQSQPRFFSAKRERVSKLHRFTNKATSNFLTDL